MSVQPGAGYTFTSSSLGTNLNIEKPWSHWIPLSASNDPPVQQFQVGYTLAENKVRLKIAKGAVNYTQSNMPEIWQNPHTNTRQILMLKTSVRPGISKVNLDQPNSPWMEDGGYYVLPSVGFYYVVICKPDFNGSIEGGDFIYSDLLKQNRPFICIFSSTDSIYDKIFDETGPSLYVNKTNIQPMAGYDEVSTGLDADWGACHTTWFNPVKYGYACKIIATVDVTGVGPSLAAKVTQHVVGSIDISVPLQFLGSTLFDKPNQIEEDDPYNVNEEAQFEFVVNHALRTHMNELPVSTATGYYLDMLSPADWTQTDYEFYDECSGQCKHPFYVKTRVIEGALKYWVCVGSVNNVMLPEQEGWLGIEADGYVYVRAEYSGGVFPSSPDGVSALYAEGTLPADTDTFGRIAIAHITGVDDPATAVCTQLVTGSLWGDRIKLGSDVARYFFARV